MIVESGRFNSSSHLQCTSHWNPPQRYIAHCLSTNCLMSSNVANEQALANAICHLPRDSQPSSNGAEFFRNAKRCNFTQSTFISVQGNMTVVYSAEQPSLVRQIKLTTSPKIDCIPVEYVSMARFRSTNNATSTYQFYGRCDFGDGVIDIDLTRSNIPHPLVRR